MIFAYLFFRIPVPQVLAVLREIRLLPYVALMIPYSLLYCTIDAFVLTRVVQWFHRRVWYRRILPVRAASYILAILNPALGQGAVAFYVHRREGIPLWAVTGTLLFLVVMEFCQLTLYASVGIFGFHPRLAAAFMPFYLVFAAVLGLALLVLHRGMAPLERWLSWLGQRLWRQPTYRVQLRRSSVFTTLQQARLSHYLLTLLYKAPNFFLAVVVHYLALQQFGVFVPLVHLFTFLPIVFLVASLPITVAHLGTSQAAWVYFFSPYGAASQILAYSLVAHVTFMVLNGVIGLVCLPFVLQEGNGTTAVKHDRDVRYPMSQPEAPDR
jgi:hypothetical protein